MTTEQYLQFVGKMFSHAEDRGDKSECRRLLQVLISVSTDKLTQLEEKSDEIPEPEPTA